jgi:hypothetical protein
VKRFYVEMAILLGFMVFVSFIAFGQVPPSPDEWSQFFTQIGQLHGASTFVIVSLFVQGVMLLFRSSIGSFAGKYQLAIISGLAVLATAVVTWNPGASLIQNVGNILFNAQFIAAINVFYHQVIQKVSAGPVPLAALGSKNGK